MGEPTGRDELRAMAALYAYVSVGCPDKHVIREQICELCIYQVTRSLSCMFVSPTSISAPLSDYCSILAKHRQNKQNEMEVD